MSIRKIFATLAPLFIIATSVNTATAQVNVQLPTGQSMVRGVVTYSDTGRPLRNASVVLLNNDGGALQWNAITNRRGEFVLKNMAAGRYLAFVDAPGILKPEGFHKNQSPVIAQLRLNEKRDLFTEVVVNGTDSVDVKVQAVRGGVITGRVVTEDDEPVAHADIKLLRSENGKWLPVAFTWVGDGERKGLRTDASGVYRIAGLTSGDYLVRVSEPFVLTDRRTTDDDAYSDGSFMVTFYPSARSVDDAQAVSVIEGSESTGIDVRMPEQTPRAISGRALGPDNQPGAFVQVWIERADETGLSNETYSTTITADSQGNWRLQGIPAGEYVVTLGGAIRIETDDGPGHFTVAPKRINVRVASEDVVVPDTKLSFGARVQGKVTLDGKPPKRPYEMFPRLVPAEDSVVRKGPKSLPTLSMARYSDGGGSIREDGSFYMVAVPPGNYWFEISRRSDEKFYIKSVTRKGLDLMQAPIKLMDATVLEDVVVTLATDFASIEGELTRTGPPTKQSLRDVLVVLAPATDATRRVAGNLYTSQADAQGRFSFTCAPGEYYLAAFTPAQVKKLTAPIGDDFFKTDQQKFTRIKVRAAEKLRGVAVSLTDK